jgi:hypothetical protein
MGRDIGRFGGSNGNPSTVTNDNKLRRMHLRGRKLGQVVRLTGDMR